MRNKDCITMQHSNKLAVYLGVSLANIANVLNPKKVVIGDGVSKAGGILLDPVREQFNRFVFLHVSGENTIDFLST
ncbi:ROK family protein [Ectobacillus funiculus]|uniref:ROK family protein n=1 Tax=Ectobacillus funiculus TaxID=137993 RepID=A0ABV5WJ48_9BACI